MTIKELRAKLNLSQSQFGGIIGVDRSDLGKMENGIVSFLSLRILQYFAILGQLVLFLRRCME